MQNLCMSNGKVELMLHNGKQMTIDLGLTETHERHLPFIAIAQFANHVDTDEQTSFLKTLHQRTPSSSKPTRHRFVKSIFEERQVTLRYSTRIRLLFLILSITLFPIWGILGTAGVLALPYVAANCSCSAELILIVCPLILAGGIITLAASLDMDLTVGESGIVFPLFMTPWLTRKDHTWKTLKRIRYQPGGNTPQHGTLQFLFEEHEVSVSLKELSSADREKLLLALNIWAQSIEQDIEIKLLQESMNDERLGVSSPSYTSMWEDEMNRRFSSTAFVPLQEGHILKSGTLKLVRTIAYGGLSAVYVVQERNTDLRLLKEFVLPDASAEVQSKARELFQRESRILMKLSHPCLAKVYDCFVEDGRTYLLLEYIPGSDLRQIVTQRGPVDEITVRQWADQLVKILAYLHRQAPQVIHRDLTPDNILLTADNQIKLIDFGAATEFVGITTGTLVGKQAFISPEQFRGETTPQSDIYSFGATLYYLLTGIEPTPLTQSFPKTIAPTISAEIDMLVADCTAVDPEHRLSSLDVVSSRLR